jgi:4-hydroxy-4-methyl-2-oxoglutarate aldolase
VVVPGGSDNACFGDITATRWRAKGIAGTVIDEATRDVAGIRALGFPVFARRVTPRTFHYPAGADHGAVNVLVSCGGVLVQPGDVIMGDDDGVVVVPRGVAAEIAAAARDYLRNETAKRAAFAQGYVPFGVADDLRERGYRFV